jgi:O-antigen ligase
MVRKGFSYLAFVLLFGIIFIPIFGAVDKVATHFLGLSILSCILSVYLCFFAIQTNDTIWLKLKREPILIVNLIFLIWGAFSFFYSKNIPEYVIVISEYSLYFITIILLIVIASINRLNINYLILLPITALFIEEYLLIIDFLELTSYNIFNNYNVGELKGFAMNKNIAVASVLIKIPFILYALSIKKKIVFDLILSIILILASGLIVIGSARSIILGLFLVLILSVFLLVYLKNKKAVFLFVGLILAGVSSAYFVNLNTNKNLVERIESIQNFENDQSASQRLRYYKHGVNHILSNPIIGTGLGNWKIESIQYESKYMSRYIVPYTLHNDFLEVGTELGIIGMILYLLIFILIIRFLITSIRKTNNEKRKLLFFSILFCFAAYLVDANFNFPLARTEIQINIIFLTSLMLLIKYDKI